MLNRCEFIGNLGRDVEVRTTQSGSKCANLRIACTEKWKKDGQPQERTEWIPVTIWGPLADVAERYLKKGSKVYVAGKFTTRKWTDNEGKDRYSTECVLQGPEAKMVMLDGKSDGGGSSGGNQGGGYDGGSQGGYGAGGQGGSRDLDDEIPFACVKLI